MCALYVEGHLAGLKHRFVRWSCQTLAGCNMRATTRPAQEKERNKGNILSIGSSFSRHAVLQAKSKWKGVADLSDERAETAKVFKNLFLDWFSLSCCHQGTFLFQRPDRAFFCFLERTVRIIEFTVGVLKGQRRANDQGQLYQYLICLICRGQWCQNCSISTTRFSFQSHSWQIPRLSSHRTL